MGVKQQKITQAVIYNMEWWCERIARTTPTCDLCVYVFPFGDDDLTHVPGYPTAEANLLIQDLLEEPGEVPLDRGHHGCAVALRYLDAEHRDGAVVRAVQLGWGCLEPRFLHALRQYCVLAMSGEGGQHLQHLFVGDFDPVAHSAFSRHVKSFGSRKLQQFCAAFATISLYTK